MLPSTGYFKGISCPFYDTGFCERPYCHFRHVKKEPQNCDGSDSGEILQKLVTAAVQKVLRQNEATGLPSTSQEGLVIGPNNTQIDLVPAKATYSPTPIAELNKIHTESEEDIIDKKRRHIPVPYTPRKPAAIQIKRPVDTNGSKLYVAPVVQYIPGAENVQLDPYTPKGSLETGEKYMPGTDAKIQEYLPNGSQQTSDKQNYVPSDKYTTKSKIIEYKPTTVTKNCDVPSLKYQPTPKSLVPCFSSDEEEPEPKKQKISGDLNGFDDLGPEFDILDQILHEEIKSDDLKTKDKKPSSTKNDSIVNNTEDKVIKNDSSKSIKKDSKARDKEEKSSKKISHKSSHDNKNKEKGDKLHNKSHSSSRSSKSKSSETKPSEKHSTSSDKSRHSKSSSSRHKEKDLKTYKENKDSRKSHDRHHKFRKKSKESIEKQKRDKKKDNSNYSSDNENLDGLENEVLSESDEETIAEECKRIFEEYVSQPKSKDDGESNKQEDLDEDDIYIPSKKRISRTIDKDIKIISKPSIKPDFKTNAAQAMAARLSKVRQFHASKTEEKDKNKEISDLAITSKPEMTKAFASPPISKVRIAHVPYASTLLTAKKSIASPVHKPAKIQPSTSFTSIQTVKKGQQRMAHIPNEKFIDRPGVLEPLASKIPANIRSTYLNLMIDQCLNIYLTATDAYARAQHEELTTSKKCSTVPIYKNSAVLAISRLKKELQECNGVKKSGDDCATLHKVPLSKNDTNSLGSWSIESRSKKIYDSMDQYTGAKFYNNIIKWVLTEEQLQENGFPRPHSSGEKGRAKIYGQNKQKPPKGYIRTCCRCKKDYTINKKGFPIIKEECVYHPNNKYRVRGEVKYQCCSQDSTSDGCCVAESHVYEYVDFDNLKGFVKTLPPQREMDDYGVYSLDCEMCYTTHGLDLTRVTVINSECKVIYESLIKPLHPIIDYNTRYSGITENQMSQVNTTLLEVQATLLSMFNSKTILIGHSLESDFKALKLIHDTVIDTSVLFPHKMGPPFKRALRNLSSEYLKKIIQNSVDGHDSAEDATVCMELLLYKLKEDLKTR